MLTSDRKMLTSVLEMLTSASKFFIVLTHNVKVMLDEGVTPKGFLVRGYFKGRGIFTDHTGNTIVDYDYSLCMFY